MSWKEASGEGKDIHNDTSDTPGLGDGMEVQVGWKV